MSKNDPYTRDDQTRFTMRINSQLLEKLRLDAEKNKRSTAKQIEFIGGGGFVPDRQGCQDIGK